jgi:SAM-dependent methyltransferase
MMCRICGYSRLIHVLSLGNLPLANALATRPYPSDRDTRYPLNLVFCPRCGLLQIRETVHPVVLFDEYPYFSSFSDTMLRHAQDLADHLTRTRRLSREHSVLEIGSNDGYLLQYLAERGIPVLGIEPAKNLNEISIQRHIPTIRAFFDHQTIRRLKEEGAGFDVILALNVFAHVPDPHGFLEGIRVLLRPGGIAIFEFPYVRELIERNEFDTIYHEHISYFCLSTLVPLFEQHGLRIGEVDRFSIHGGSIRITAGHLSETQASNRVQALMEEEREIGLLSPRYYLDFARSIEKLKADTLAFLRSLKAEGKTIAGYGAAAKGSTLLNYYGIGRETIDFIADRNPYKQGRYLVGNYIPIVAPDRIRAARPDYVLILPWNLRDEITEQLAYIREWGGKFILPVPRVEVIP